MCEKLVSKVREQTEEDCELSIEYIFSCAFIFLFPLDTVKLDSVLYVLYINIGYIVHPSATAKDNK